MTKECPACEAEVEFEGIGDIGEVIICPKCGIKLFVESEEHWDDIVIWLTIYKNDNV